MRKRILVPAVALLIGAALLPMWLAAADPVTIARLDTDVALTRDADYLTGFVPTRTTIGAVLDHHLIEGPERAALVASIGGAFDLRRIRAGQPYTIDRLLDGRVRRFEYEIDGDQRLTATRGTLDGTPRFHTAIERIPKDSAVVMVEGAIDRDTNSLSAALNEAGERIELALGLADVFSGEIDFNSGLQPGDTFRLLVDRQTREGKLAGYGPILAAEFVNDGRQLRAIRFTPEGGSAAYYDDQGRSLKRFFLKSPLKFEPRVTSRFSSSRKHPILGYARAHNGVDYGAGTGAPVVSVAPGVVTHAGWSGGGGRTVKVRHANGYETEYLHLSAITVRKGARIGQGDLVGRVGQTGLATGPHLHYGLKKNGRYVNPILEHRNMPPGEPVPAALRNVFASERDLYLSLLFSSPATRAANN